MFNPGAPDFQGISQPVVKVPNPPHSAKINLNTVFPKPSLSGRTSSPPTQPAHLNVNNLFCLSHLRGFAMQSIHKFNTPFGKTGFQGPKITAISQFRVRKTTCVSGLM
ncbi:hypothetical protein T265_04897 [Opisthorchis viverrini]|uniref:Uncharacterized protein n=1 Tax=Opisthorchis viverrini TaxID=6198 RepID=A0A074ZMD4_OPIVI|nr:hypothetical protein T265_04897 [Opisthorchis viverrini]KER28221.1 hypothetical protein T265_04897 [Opisthorchis viverrini]